MPSAIDLMILIKAEDQASAALKGVGGVMGTLGVGALAAGSAIAAGLAVGIKSAGDLQQSVANISTIKPDIDTSGVFAKLNEISTRVPQSAKQLGDGLYNIFSSVDVSAEQGLSLVETFAKGAVGASTDAQTFGTAALGVMNAYGLATEDAGHISDVFFNTVNKGVVTGQELAANLGLVTQSAKMAGVDLDSLGGFIAGVTKEGGPAAQNMNNLNNLFLKIGTTQAVAGFRDLGIATADATGKLRPQIDVLSDLKTATEGMTEVAKQAAIQKIFPDLQARAGAAVIMDQLDFIKGAIEDNKNEVGSAASAYEKMSATFNSQTALLGNAMTAILTTIGGELLPAITPLVTAFSKDLPDAFTGISAIFTAFSVDAGAMGIALDMVRKIFGDTVADAIEPFVQAFMAAIPAIKAFAGTILDVFGTVGGFVKQALGGDVIGALEGFLSLVGGIRDKLVPLLAGWAAAFLEWIVPLIPQFYRSLAQIEVALIGWIADQVPGYVAQLMTWGKAFLDWIGPLIPLMLTALGEIATELLGWIADRVPDVLARLAEWGQAFIDWVGPQIQPMLDGLAAIAAAVIGWIGDRVPEIAAQLTAWGAEFTAWVTPAVQALPGELAALSAAVLGWIGEQAPGFATELADWGAAFIKWIAPAVATLPGELASINGTLIHFIVVDALPEIIGSLIGWGIAFVKWIADVVPQLPGELAAIIVAIKAWVAGDGTAQVSAAASGLGASLIDGIRSGIAGAVEGLKKSASDAVSNTIAAARAAADAHSPSREMAKLGQDMADGLVMGIQSGAPDIADAMSGTLQTAMAGLQRGGTFLTVPQFGTAIRKMGFNEATIESICGPIAAQGISNGLGKAMSLIDVEKISEQIGAFSPGAGTGGTGAFQKILSSIGIDSRTASFQEAVDAAMKGIPVAISTPLHYFLAQGFDQATQQFVVGNTGTALKAGAEKMTAAAIEGVAGAATYIIPALKEAGAAVSDLAGSIANGFTDVAAPATKGLADTLDKLVGAVDTAGSDMAVKMSDIATKVSTGIAKATEDGAKQIANAMTTAQNSLNSLGGSLADPSSVAVQQTGLEGQIAAAKALHAQQRSDADALFAHQEELAKAATQLDKDMAKAKSDLDRANIQQAYKDQVAGLDASYAQRVSDTVRTRALDAADKAFGAAEDAKLVAFKQTQIIATRDAAIEAAKATTAATIAAAQDGAEKERAVLVRSYAQKLSDLKSKLLDLLPGLTGDEAAQVQGILDTAAAQTIDSSGVVSGAIGATAAAAQNLVKTFGISFDEASRIVNDHGKLARSVFGPAGTIPGDFSISDKAVETFADKMGVSWDQARAILEAGAATSDAIMKVRIPAAAGVTTDALNAVKIKATEMPSALSQLQDAANNLVEQGLDPASKAARDLQTAISEIQNRTIEVVTHYTSTGSPGSATSGGANPGAVGDNSGDSNTGAPVRGSVGMDQASGSSSSAPDTSQSALSDQSNRADLRKQGYAVGQNPDGTYYAEKRAAGGPVSAGSTYLVGEKGMELFRPASSGTIVPNGAWGGSHPIDYDKLGAAVAKALRQQPPVVAVEAVRSSLIKIGQRNGGTVGLA